MERNASFLTFTGHTGCVYSSVFDAIDPNLLASCSSEGIAYVWDIRAQPSPTMSLPHYAQVMAHSHEALSLDWDKYNSMILATASADKSIKVWDLRYVMKEQNYGNLSSPIVTIPGHSYAIRKIKFSPVHTMTLASASYDMTCKIWNADALNTKLIKSYENHREFVVGIDFNMYIEGFFFFLFFLIFYINHNKIYNKKDWLLLVLGIKLFNFLKFNVMLNINGHTIVNQFIGVFLFPFFQSTTTKRFTWHF